MTPNEYMVNNGDQTAKELIESIKVFCPECGNQANLIWSGGNEGKWYASWHCHCKASAENRRSGWWTSDPEPFREKPQQFKTLFDF